MQCDAEAGRHNTRGRPLRFKASDGFVTSLKRRQRLSSHRTALHPVSRRALADRDVDAESFEYVTAVRDAVMRLGERMVHNMDETPAQLADIPTTAVVPTGSGEAAEIETDFMHKVRSPHMA